MLAPATPPEKLSRYKSASSPLHREPIPSDSAEKIDDKTATIQRSLSRYRKPGASQGISYVSPVPQNLQGANVHCKDDSVHKGGSKVARSTDVNGIGRETGVGHVLNSRLTGSEPDKSVRRSRKTVAKAIPLGKPRDGEEAVDAAEIAELLAQQKRKDLERLERELDAAVKKPTTPPKPNPVTSKIGTLLSRKLESPKNDLKSAPKSSIDAVSNSKSKGSHEVLRAGAGVLAGVDAPVSAVNAGERRILLRCKQSCINLPVTSETITTDLIYSAANVLSEAVTPSVAVLVESYAKLGLERRIRRYEHIRDVMNSWDRDFQNEVILTMSNSANDDSDLEASSVRKQKPEDVTLQMYHSQHIGNWEKRYVTLLSSGQIFTAKKPGAIITDKDVTTICRLTDFDIYTITTRQLRKNVKPPRKHCYAIKSQQKPNMFLNTDDFVHFFSIDDTIIADKWYAAVQTWRSWYLINVKGEGLKSDAPSSSAKSRMAGREKEKPKPSSSDKKEPYIIGSLTPLLDLESLSKSFHYGDLDDDDRPLQIPPHLRNTPGPAGSSQEKHLRNHPPAAPSRQSRPGTARDSSDLDRATGTAKFATNGLLGRTYTQRPKNRESPDAAAQSRDAGSNGGPFVHGSLLMNTTSTAESRPATSSGSASKISHGLKRTFAPDLPLLNNCLTAESRPQTSSGAANKPSDSSPRRAMSMKQTSSSTGPRKFPPVPLVDLTPKFVEPQQWNKDGKGHGVAGPAGARLIDGATSRFLGPELSPKAALLRRDM